MGCVVGKWNRFKVSRIIKVNIYWIKINIKNICYFCIVVIRFLVINVWNLCCFSYYLIKWVLFLVCMILLLCIVVVDFILWD